MKTLDELLAEEGLDISEIDTHINIDIMGVLRNLSNSKDNCCHWIFDKTGFPIIDVETILWCMEVQLLRIKKLTNDK